MAWFDSKALIAFGRDALVAVGVSEDDARLTSRSLVVADQRGTHSHGLLRLPLYIAAIEGGGINASPSMRWEKASGATALLQADGALGQVAMQLAVDRAVDLAVAEGVGVVAVEGSSHYGAGAFWAEQLTDRGYLAIITSTTGPTVAPYGGVQKVLGTNPLTMATPARGGEALVADLATSTGAYGKVIAARDAGEELPAGWAVGPDGAPTRDPQAAMSGALTAFGGHKGSSIAAALEAFSAVLGTGTFAYETEDIWNNPASRMNIGQLLIVINPEFFRGGEFARDRTGGLLNAIRGSAPSGGRVYAPGEPERIRAVDAGEHVEITPSVEVSLRSLADRLDIAMPAAVA